MDLPTLRSHFETLYKSSKEARDPNDTKECWDLLVEYAREAVNSESDRVFVGTLLFDRHNGVFGVVDQSLRSQGKLAKQLHIDILAYVTSLLEALGSNEGSPHAAFILEKCLHFFKRFELGAVKAATFGPIIEILGWNAEVLLKLKLDPCGMAHSFQREYAVNKKLSNTVKGGILQVLGLIFDQFSEEFVPGVQFDCEWLQRECLAVLEKSKTQGLPETYVAGALSGLAATLIHEDGRNPEALRIGYDHIKRALQPSTVQAAHRYLGIRGAMKVLTQCAAGFGHTLTKDLTLLDYLVQLRSKHTNKMVRNSSEEALNAVFKQISKDLSSASPVSGFDPFDTTSRLLGILRDMLSGSHSENRELMVAVSGVGHLAEPCKKFFGQEGLEKLLADLLPLVDAGHVLESIEDLQEAAAVSDMILLVALGQIVGHLDIVNYSAIEMCQNVMGRIIGSYLNLWPRQHQAVHDSIVQMLLSLQQHPLALQSMVQFLTNVLLTHTLRPPTGKIFSGPLTVNSPEEISRNGWSHYLKIWLAVLKREHLGEEVKGALEGHPSLGSAKSISTLTYDSLLRSILDALRNLDIGYDAVRDDEVGQLDTEGGADETQVLAVEVGFGLQASNRGDMLTFMVLSEFTCTILRDGGPSAFLPWSQIVTVELVGGSTKHPLLPGYYKMLTENVKLCHTMGMFDLSHQEDGIDAYVKQLCSGVFREYLLEVLVACRRYAGELLCSCLTLLLTSPSTLLPSHQLSTPVKLALSLGLQHPEVAYVALTALEAMESDGIPIKPSMLLEILPNVVPYLRESIKIGNSKDNHDSRRKEYTDVEATQRRILLWLGRQGGFIHNMIGNTDGANGKHTVFDGANWDPEKRIGLKIEFPEMKQMSTIWLDALIPQASMLAEASGDRSCRVSACELLHSVILWMVGTNAGRPMSRTDEDFQPVPTRFHRILKKLLPVALRLAVSPEPVAKQLFEPLIFTLIHWLTRSARSEAAETMCLLDAIMVGLGDETSGALRELCARAAAEFLKWSAKHVPKQSTGNSHPNNLNAASLLRRLFDRLSHPQPYHRLGAALALGHCARVLRNEEDLTEDYSLEALHYCVHALRIAEGDALGSGTVKQTSHAVSAIVHHCIAKCSQNLIVENPNRAGFASLGVFMEWLWKRTICLEAACRRRCMLLHRKLAEFALRNEDRSMVVGPSGQWWKQYAEATRNRDGGLLQEFLSLKVDILTSDSQPISVSRLRLWLKSLEGALEWAAWALEEGIVPTEAVLTLFRNSTDDNNVIASLGIFFDFISDPSMVSSAEWSTTSPPLSGCDREAQDVVIAALALLKVIDCATLGFDPVRICRFFASALFAPGLIGLRPFDERLHRRIALDVCLVIRESLLTSPAFGTELSARIGLFVGDVLSNQQETCSQLSQETWLEALGPVGAATFCHGVSLLLGIFSTKGVPFLSPTVASGLPRQCLDMVVKMVTEGSMSHIEKQAAEGCLSLGIQLGLPANELLSVLLESEHSAKLYNAFPSVVHRWILFNAETCCPKLCAALCQQGEASWTAEAMLTGTFESLAHSEMISRRIDPLQASFRSCVLSSMGPCAVVLKSTDSQPFAKTMVRILKTLVGGGDGSWLSPTQTGYSSIVDAFLALLALRDRKSAPIRSQALQLLPSFLAFQESADSVVKAVDLMVTDVFPSISSKMKRGLTEAREYGMQLKELLDATANAAKRNQPDVAIKLLEILLPVIQELGSTEGHIYQDAVETRLALFAAAPWIQTSKGQNPSGALDAMKDKHETVRKLIDYAWGVVFIRKGLSVALKRAMCRSVLIPLLECSSVEITRGFFSNGILKIVEGAEKPISLVEGEGLVTRLCAFMLLERMYCLLKKDVLESEILSQLPKKNQTVMKLCVSQAKEVGAPSSDFKDLYRQVCCAAFCAASSLLVLTQSNPKFFTLALQGKKGSPPTQLWRNMMAVNRSLSFSVESAGEGSKAQIARASNAVARVEQYTKGQGGGFLGAGETLGNLTFAQTTLSVKIASSQFSLGMEDELPPEGAPFVPRTKEAPPSTPTRKSPEMVQTTQDVWGGLNKATELNTQDKMVIEALPFCEDELDKHESMLALVQLIERASELPCSNDKDLPIWQILASLQSAAVPRYAKLLLCKAIIHIETRHMSKVPQFGGGSTQQHSQDAFKLDMETGDDAMEADEEKPDQAPRSTSVFSRFAEQFFPPMLDAIMDDLRSEGGSSMKGTFHYLLRDLCLVWLRWGALFERASSGALKYESEIGGAGRKLMRHLLLVGFSSNADVLRVNFEYIRAFIGQWGACVPLPVDALLMLIQPNKDEKKSSDVIQKQMILGLKLMAVALKYGQGEAMICGPQSEGLWKGLLSVCQFSRPGSRLCRQAGETTGLFARAISKHPAAPSHLAIEKVESEVKDGIRTLFGKFLHGGLLGYLDGMSEFYPNIVDASKTWILHVLVKVDGSQRTTALQVLRTRARQLPDLFLDITRREILGSMLASRFPDVQLSILGLIRDLLPLQAQEPAAKVVASVVHAFVNHANEKWRISLFELLRDAWQLWPDADVRDKYLKGPLVALLSDESQEVHRELMKFWHSILPHTLPERLEALLALSVDPGSPWTDKIQRRWPQVAASLLLELPKSTPTYEKAVFETSLAECKFMDYSVNTWQGPNTATMFSMGTTSYSQDQYSLGGFGGSPSKIGRSFQGRTAVQVSPNRVRATMATTLTPTIALSLPVESSVGQSASQAKASNSPSREQRAHLRRRVYKSTGVEAGIAATLRREAAERKRREERQSRVQLYRTYRAGELPDIQGIKVSGFVAPIAQIAMRDTTTACAVVAAIARTFFDEIQQSQGNSRILENIHQQVARCLSSKSQHSGYVQSLAGIAVAGHGIWIAPASLVSSARSSGEYQAMAFVLEKQMIDLPLTVAAESKRPSSRKHGSSTVPTHPVGPALRTDDDAWMCLAELYCEMGKGDFLHVIRMGHLTKCPGSRRALVALQSGRAAVALDLCEKLLEAYDEGMMDREDSLIGGEDASPLEANIWYDDKMECLEKLGCWKVLQDQIGLELNETGEMLEQSLGRLVSNKDDDKHLGRYLRPFVRSCLFQRTEQNTLALLLDPIKSDREKMELLYATVPAELACVHAARSEWTAALADLRASLKSFCVQWSGTDVRSSDARHSLLSLLQPMTEAQEVIETVLTSRREDGSVLVSSSDVEKCARQWLIRWPSASHDREEQALAIVSFRELLLSTIQPITYLNNKNSSTHLFVRKLMRELKLCAASRYQSQGMSDLAQELLEECRLEFIGKQNADMLPYLVTKVEICVAKIKEPLEHELTLYSTLNRDLEGLAGYKNSMERSVEFQLRAAVVQGEGYWMAAHQPGIPESERSLKTSMSFKKWMEIVQMDHSEHIEGVAKAALGFALLCNELIEEYEATATANVTFQGMSEEVKGKIDSWGGLSATMVSTLLRSMALGCSDASLYVPRILTAMIHDHVSRDEFAKGWKNVPLSAFLPWISQMMGQLEEDMGSALVPCLGGLADQYPQHLYFPFHLCQANLQSVGKSRMRSFEAKMNIPVLKEFADALHKLTYPVQRWEGYEALIMRALQAGDKNEASRIFSDEAVPDLFASDSDQTVRFCRNNINAKFSKTYKSALTSAFGTDGTKITSMSADAFRKKSRQIVAKAKDDLSKQQGKCELSLFTPWFSDFTTSYSSEASAGSKLFLPRMACVGDGGGFHDVGVVGFGKTVDIFSSKQKPKKLTVYAEDFTAYEFVVKGGEELRIDQRVEQLFGVMNGLVAQNPAAASRNLKMRTYDVIPLSSSLGLLAFVDGTRPLESVMVPGTIPQSEYKKSAEVFQGFITKGMGGYENIFKQCNRDYVIRHFEKAESLVRWDGLREALVRYSGSPEGFIRFREVFLQSLSVTCVMGYIAGVGDRHLQNFLVEEASGALIPIDFGYSFGTATQVLPIPELMPFRLTRQLIEVSAPHDGKAILKMYMKEIMVALRQGKQVIEGIMEAFLREPLLDWQREAQLLSKMKGKKVAQGDVEHHEEMHAQLKVEHSRQKLKGKHPVDIMMSELAGRHSGKPYWKTLEAVVRGDPNANIRAQVKCRQGAVLSCEEQVECLLDQATDGNILGRTWWGWRPWI